MPLPRPRTRAPSHSLFLLPPTPHSRLNKRFFLYAQLILGLIVSYALCKHFTCCISRREDPVDDESSTRRLPSMSAASSRAGEELLSASERGDLSAIATIVSEEGSPVLSYADADGYTALHRAAYNGHVQVLHHLLERCDDHQMPCRCRSVSPVNINSSRKIETLLKIYLLRMALYVSVVASFASVFMSSFLPCVVVLLLLQCALVCCCY